MFGLRKLTPEERKELDKKKRIAYLKELLHKETQLRKESLEKSQVYQKELESLQK